MSSTRLLATAFALCAIAVAGCGLGPGEDEGGVDLTVSRDYGRDVLAQKRESIKQSDTVLRVLDRNAEVATRYGGGFVQSIDGLAGTASGGRTSDWFFYVNGIESPIGSAQYDLSGGDRIWWDYRDWTAAMRVPAVVGSWPEPFAHGFQDDHWPASIDCHTAPATCQLVASKLASAGARTASAGGDSIDVEVGPWNAILSRTPEMALLAQGPERSGVFARFGLGRRPILDLLNERGEIAGSIGKGGGLVAALRDGDDPPVWVVTGTDDKGVAAAAGLLGDQLRNHYAVATQPGAGPIGVPVP